MIAEKQTKQILQYHLSDNINANSLFEQIQGLYKFLLVSINNHSS